MSVAADTIIGGHEHIGRELGWQLGGKFSKAQEITSEELVFCSEVLDSLQALEIFYTNFIRGMAYGLAGRKIPCIPYLALVYLAGLFPDLPLAKHHLHRCEDALYLDYLNPDTPWDPELLPGLNLGPAADRFRTHQLQGGRASADLVAIRQTPPPHPYRMFPPAISIRVPPPRALPSFSPSPRNPPIRDYQVSPRSRGDLPAASGSWDLFNPSEPGQPTTLMNDLTKRFFQIHAVSHNGISVLYPEHVDKLYDLVLADRPYRIWAVAYRKQQLKNRNRPPRRQMPAGLRPGDSSYRYQEALIIDEERGYDTLYPAPAKHADAEITDKWAYHGYDFYPVSSAREGRPAIPCLTLSGFTQLWMADINTFPNEAHRRLNAVLSLTSCREILQDHPDLPREIPRDALPASRTTYGDEIIARAQERQDSALIQGQGARDYTRAATESMIMQNGFSNLHGGRLGHGGHGGRGLYFP